MIQAPAGLTGARTDVRRVTTIEPDAKLVVAGFAMLETPGSARALSHSVLIA
jgi:hypothetical protein